jgi:hypothetical protein
VAAVERARDVGVISIPNRCLTSRNRVTNSHTPAEELCSRGRTRGIPVETAESLPPEEAFAVLGNEIRVDVLRTLAAADEPLAFSELYDRVDVADSGQFNYHLDQTLGHFVVDGDDGYRLADPGRRVVEAVLSGAVTDRPEMDRRSVRVTVGSASDTSRRRPTRSWATSVGTTSRRRDGTAATPTKC